ncbi:MAG: FAD-dependent oxidoreductase, partial [Candidatus Lokiarchaeota archaeon]|nr:FAD-dependent oxidoreductase [Candidatus Lokiarchaeota archaeon]
MIYDVIIVGGGPAGSTAAYYLKDSQLDVLLLDRAEFPREKPCGGALTWPTLDLFPHISEFMEVGYKYGALYFKEGYKPLISAVKDRYLGYFVRRKIFDKQLLDQANSDNIEMKMGVRVISVKQNKENVIVVCTNGEKYTGRIVIGADGTNSTVRKNSPLDKYWKKDKLSFVLRNEIHIGKEEIIKHYTKLHKSFIHFSFGGSYGYGWVFSKKKHINIGFGAMTSDISPREVFKLYNKYFKYCRDNN